MTAPICATGCGRPSPHAYLCRSCERDLEQALAELPAGLSDLQRVATRQATGPLGLGDPQRQWDGPACDGALGDEPWVFAPGAADLFWTARNTMSTWIRHLCLSRGLSVPDGQSMSGWLYAHVASIAQDEAAAAIYDEFTWLARAIAAAVLGPPPETEFHGLCDRADVRVVYDGTTIQPVVGACDAQLFSAPKATEITCQACGAVYTREQRRASMLKQLDPVLATVADAAAVLTDLGETVTVGQVKGWLRYGQIAARPGRSKDDPRLVRIGDVRDMRAKMAERRRMTA